MSLREIAEIRTRNDYFFKILSFKSCQFIFRPKDMNMGSTAALKQYHYPMGEYISYIRKRNERLGFCGRSRRCHLDSHKHIYYFYYAIR